MIIQFPNGAAIDSSVIASIHVSAGEKLSGGMERPPHIVVYTFRQDLSFNLFGREKPAASHFLSVPMPSENEANDECRRLVARWMGLPEPKLTVVTADNGTER